MFDFEHYCIISKHQFLEYVIIGRERPDIAHLCFAV